MDGGRVGGDWERFWEDLIVLRGLEMYYMTDTA